MSLKFSRTTGRSETVALFSAGPAKVAAPLGLQTFARARRNDDPSGCEPPDGRRAPARAAVCHVICRGAILSSVYCESLLRHRRAVPIAVAVAVARAVSVFRPSRSQTFAHFLISVVFRGYAPAFSSRHFFTLSFYNSGLRRALGMAPFCWSDIWTAVAHGRSSVFLPRLGELFIAITC